MKLLMGNTTTSLKFTHSDGHCGLWVQPVCTVMYLLSLFVHDSISQHAAFQQPACVGVKDTLQCFFFNVQSPHFMSVSNATTFMEILH